MGKLIIVASGKGGTGKTTVTSHLGAVLAERGHLTALVDADAGFRNLDIALGMESSIVYDYSDCISGSQELDDVLLRCGERENLYFIAAPQSVSTSDFEDERVEEFWAGLKSRFEFVLADAPAGMGDGFLFAAKYADEAIIVSLPETSSLRDADRVVAELEELGTETVRLVLNRMDAALVEDKILMNADDCIDVLSIPILGIIPEDGAVTGSMTRGEPLMRADGFGAGTAFSNIAARLEGQSVPMMRFISKNRKGFFKRLKSLFQDR